ncbi:MAG: diguanylate cyclase, partial [Gammaproteobacteria bacterium]
RDEARRALQAHQAELERTIEARTAELRDVNAKLSKLAIRDGLTGLYNRRAFDERLQAELQRAHRGGDHVALVLGDVDFFKLYNDHYGHPAGDDCLVQVAEALTRSFSRADDFVARYGGEEFAVIISRSDESATRRSVERFQQEIHALALPHEKSEVSEHVTLSLGVTIVGPSFAPSPADVVMLADKALYSSKESGRDRYTVTDQDAIEGVLTIVQ